MKRLTLVLMVLVTVALVAVPAMAQKTDRMVIALPIGEAGIRVEVTTPHGQVPFVSGATLTVSLVEYDWETGEVFVDLASSRKSSAKGRDGKYFIPAVELPASKNPYDSWRQIDVRAEAEGLAHYIFQPSRVWTDGTQVIYAPPITMWQTGLEISEVYMWWESKGMIGIGIWARQNWPEDLIVDFSFEGSAWTKVRADLGTYSDYRPVGPEWDIVYQYFYAPADSGIGNYGGSFCGQMTLRGQTAEDVRERTQEICLGHRPTGAVGKVEK